VEAHLLPQLLPSSADKGPRCPLQVNVARQPYPANPLPQQEQLGASITLLTSDVKYFLFSTAWAFPAGKFRGP